jgi:hypothetical protein
VKGKKLEDMPKGRWQALVLQTAASDILAQWRGNPMAPAVRMASACCVSYRLA